MIHLLLAFFIFPVFAATFKYEGEAKIKGKLVYTEKHQYTTGANGEVLESEAQYLDANGVLIGEVKNDHRSSLSVPAHTMKDIRKKNKHGVRYQVGEIELFTQDDGEKEKFSKIKNDPKKGLMVASQGLHYYVVANFEKMKVKDFPLQFLIPGRLDSYRFVWSYMGKNKDGQEEFEVEIDNWFLKLFAPKLKLQYNAETKRLVYYKGLSNISDDKGEMMNVEITYKY